MSAAAFTNTCVVCGAEESLDGLLHRMIDDDTVRRLIADVLAASLPLGGLVVRYLRLHKPPKQKLRMAIVAKLLAELVPDLQRGVIERTGRSWVCDNDGWKAALQAVFDAQDKGTLTLPLQGNGYLYQVVMNMADKTEAVAEKQTDAERRQRAGSKLATDMPPGGMTQVMAGLPPELVRRNLEAAESVPVPAHVRAYRAALPVRKAARP